MCVDILKQLVEGLWNFLLDISFYSGYQHAGGIVNHAVIMAISQDIN
jgi:hypothetical protein